ncbi:fimbrial protein [Pantoea sp. Z09]|uniref:fimbrial protein n=1 Tax=Pantoea sp. Z09 TaxID=2886821 RepID=UPI001EFCDD21|nr:fimbrial protein [Pantoea sp. Z09]
MRLTAGMLTGVVLWLAADATAAAQGVTQENLSFHGNLTELPCTILDGDRSLQVHMGAINARDLYSARSATTSFSLHLEGCDTRVSSSVTATFTGTQDPQLAGYLLPEVGSASGIALGLADGEGNALPLDRPSTARALTSGENVLSFAAWVEGEPEAIRQKNIVPGDFTATATLTLSYP